MFLNKEFCADGSIYTSENNWIVPEELYMYFVWKYRTSRVKRSGRYVRPSASHESPEPG